MVRWTGGGVFCRLGRVCPNKGLPWSNTIAQMPKAKSDVGMFLRIPQPMESVVRRPMLVLPSCKVPLKSGIARCALRVAAVELYNLVHSP